MVRYEGCRAAAEDESDYGVFFLCECVTKFLYLVCDHSCLAAVLHHCFSFAFSLLCSVEMFS